MISQYLIPAQPPRPVSHVEYEVSHHQSCGQYQVLITSIGTFPTLQDAQTSAHDVLGSTLNQYMSRGWSGYYCNNVDLEFRGLIAGRVTEHQCTYLSEVQIHARERTRQVGQPHCDSVGASAVTTGHEPSRMGFGYNTTSQTYVALAVTEMLTPWQPVSAPTQTQQHFGSYGKQPGSSRRTDSFSRTRPQYPDRSRVFLPRPSAQYDEIMSFTAARSPNNADLAANTGHARQEAGTQHHGNNLGGDYDIGQSYLGRRHSSIELKTDNKHFQNEVEEH